MKERQTNRQAVINRQAKTDIKRYMWVETQMETDAEKNKQKD